MSEMFLPVRPGTPKPAISRKRPVAAPRKKYPVETTPVGQAFFVPGRTVRRISAYISRITKDHPGKFSTRPAWGVQADGVWNLVDEGTPDAVEGVSVWRDE